MEGKTPTDANSVGVLFLKDSFKIGPIFKTVGFSDGFSIAMIKTASAAIACVALAAPAMAGPYVNIENNAGWAGSNYGGSTTDFHVGYEGGNDVASYYIQGGPSYQQPDGAAGKTVFTGKVGGSVAATDNLGVYGELSMATGDTKSYGSKIGVKYKF